MTRQTRRSLMGIGAVLLTLGALGWAFAQLQSTRPDASVDNGMNSTLPGPPPEAARAMRKMMDARRASGQGMPTPPPEGQPFDREAARAAMAEVLTPEEQQAMREGMQRMMEQRRKIHQTLGPEQARAFEGKMRTRIRQFMQQQAMGGPGGGPGAPAEGE